MKGNIYIYLFIMAAVTYAIRVLPLTIFKKQIKNTFFQSFLYYVPYVTLAIMTFPTIINCTQSPISGLGALIVGIIVAWFGGNLFHVAISCCGFVLLLEAFII